MKPSIAAFTRRRIRQAALLATVAILLQACGGGGGGSSSTVGSSTPTVSAITPDRLIYGQLSTFTATGTNLDNAATFSATGCDGFLVLAGGTATQQRFTCTPNKALSVRAAVSAGGSEIYSTTLSVPKPAPTVSAIAADRLSYGQLSTFTANGTNLDFSATFAATGCDGLVVLAGGSATQQRFTCTPNKALSVRAAASDGGSEVYSTTLPVPKPRVTLTTTMGTVVVELEPAIVQLTVDNFLAYVNSGFYNGTIIHRVVRGFVSQGGGFTGVAGGTLAPQAGARAAIALETNKGLSNLRGSIGMARTSAPDSATSQFFFNAGDNTFNDWISIDSPGYAVFGTIVTGLTVIDAIDVVATHTVGPYANVPIVDIVVQTAAQTM